MAKWALLFILVPIGGVGLFVVAPSLRWDLVENVSTFGREIDLLYYVILAVTGVTFIGTQAFLVYILVRFGRGGATSAWYSHGNQRLEVIWTLIPAGLLGFIAIVQMPTWIKLRYPSAKPRMAANAKVIAHQFAWRMIYPGADGKTDTADDIEWPNELHVVKNEQVLIELQSMDVLHDFFLPHMRIKHDAVPGLRVPIWFDSNKSTFEFQATDMKFTPLDFRDATLFMEIARKQARPVDQIVWASLSEDVRHRISSLSGDAYPSDALVAALAADLNALLPRDDFYDTQRFTNIKLAADTLEHLTLRPGAVYPAVLNRQLLRDAYPTAIEEIKKHFEIVCAELCGWGHYKMKGRLVVHETPDLQRAWLESARLEQETSR